MYHVLSRAHHPSCVFLSTLALFLKVSIAGQHYGTKSQLEMRQSSWDQFHNPVPTVLSFSWNCMWAKGNNIWTRSLSKMSQGLGILVRLADVILIAKSFARDGWNVPTLAAKSRVAWGPPQEKAVLARTRFREFWWKDPINGLRVFARRGHPCKEPV